VPKQFSSSLTKREVGLSRARRRVRKSVTLRMRKVGTLGHCNDRKDLHKEEKRGSSPEIGGLVFPPISWGIRESQKWHRDCIDIQSEVTTSSLSRHLHSGRRQLDSKRRRNQFKAYAAVAGLILGAVLAVLALFLPALHSLRSKAEPILAEDAGNELLDFSTSVHIEPVTKDPHRPVYPYSVVAGGVRSLEELKLAIAKDPVVAEHYVGFDSVRAHVVKLREDKLAYVSYRLGNEVFWTKKRIRLAKGEPLITDGESYARTRCANRVSENPQPKTSPHEPSPQTLNKPLDPASREVIAALIPPTLLNPAGGPFASGTLISSPNPGLIPPPSGVGLVPLGGGNPTENPNPPSLQPPPPLVTSTPEPGTLLLMGSGLAGLAALRRKFKP
jgi:PEP-CTERM motif